MRTIFAALGVLLSCCLMAQASTIDERSGPRFAGTADTAVARFLDGPARTLTSYRALRTLEAESRGGQMRAQLTAWTSLDPVRGFEYSVVEESGSGLIRQKVLRAALEAERTLRAHDEAERGALTQANYDFGAAQDGVGGLVRIDIHPKRRDTMLIEGSVLLTDDDGDLRRVEGFLVKRPSFWTREVRVVRNYERIQGVRVPVSMASTARVLVAGRSTFLMTYKYTAINGALLRTRSE